MDSFSALGRSVPFRMTGDVRTRGEQVLTQSKPQAGQRPSSQIVTEDVHLAVDKRGSIGKEKNWAPFQIWKDIEHTRCAVSCGPTSCPTCHLEQMLGDLIQEAEKWDWHQSLQFGGGQEFLIPKRRKIFQLAPRQDARGSFLKSSRSSVVSRRSSASKKGYNPRCER